MNLEMAVALALGGLAGGFVNGLSGMGTALFALTFFLLTLDPERAVALAALLAVFAGVQGMWVVRGEIRADLRRVLRFILPGLAGVPLGLLLLGRVDADLLRRMIAVILVLYGGYFGLRKALPRLERPHRWVDRSAGFAGGVLGGLASLSGLVPAIWLSMRGWPRGETRAVLQSFNLVILLVVIGGLALKGAYGRETLEAFAVVLPAGVVAAQAGIFVFHRITDAQFQRLLILLCLCLGLGMLLRDALAG